MGVSGSHGKSTTSQLVGAMLEGAGRDFIVGGNYRHGQQGLDRLEHAGPETVLLLEVSNRHLKLLRRSPGVAVLTNVYPNHLDEHGGWDGYVEAKSRLLRQQRQGDIAVLNSDLDVTRAMAALGEGDKRWFGRNLSDRDLGVRVDDDVLVPQGIDVPVLERARLSLRGEHNAMNVAAAAVTASALGIAAMAIERVATTFHGLKHRLQLTWDVGGVQFFDDLNSSTPTATQAALRTLDRPVVWILGGEDKGLSSRELAETARDRVRLALALPGPGTDGVVAELERQQVLVEWVPDLARAVHRAVEVALRGDAVLLSPACPGFYSLYYVGADEDTGFRQLVREATLDAGGYFSSCSYVSKVSGSWLMTSRSAPQLLQVMISPSWGFSASRLLPHSGQVATL